MPNGYLDRSQKSQCLFFDTKKRILFQTCKDDSKWKFFTNLDIYEKYDTIKIINGKPSDRYELYKREAYLQMPFSLADVVFDRNKETEIYIETDNYGSSYGLTIGPKDWLKDKLVFTYYYRK